MEIQKAQGREERLELEATGQSQKDERRQLNNRDEDNMAVVWRENLESHQENMKSWVEDLENWQTTLGGGEEPLRKRVIIAFFVVFVIAVMLIVLVLYIRDIA